MSQAEGRTPEAVAAGREREAEHALELARELRRATWRERATVQRLTDYLEAQSTPSPQV